ncbi:MAG: hypothetical protein KFF50_13555 [Desulfatitalea sp.]|nr:hypothetical protein [Desulfatitalea sp.]
MIVQIYEIQTLAEAEAMIELGVDHLGSVLLSRQRWRDPGLRDVIDAVRAAGRTSSLIPLFKDVATTARAIAYYRPDIIHFCESLPAGDLDNGPVAEALSRQQEIRKQFPGVAIMRSIPIGSQGHGDALPSLPLATRFEPVSDWFLTDTVLIQSKGIGLADQPVNGFVGITGRTCDWAVARDLVRQSAIPVILAGGIGPRNAREGIAQVQPAGVDSCTLTNATDAGGKPIRFKKDPEKVKALVDAAREAAQRAPTIQ